MPLINTQTSFFQKVNYASFHEDSNSERRALKLQNQDRVLCLTGSGARPLDLLLDQPAEVVAIDWNPAQSHLLELKVAVLRQLPYQQGLTFLGFQTSNQREQIYSTLRSELSTSAQKYWDQNTASIRRGVFFDGRWEKFLRRASWFARLTRRKLVDELLNADDISSQHRIWVDKWDNRIWQTFLSVATNRFLVQHLLREPGLEFIPNDLSISKYITERFEQASSSFLFRESPWIWALFKGRIDQQGPLPEHLKPENFELLRSRLSSISIVTDSLQSYLHTNHSPFDAFSLSDFSSYCDQSTYNSLWEALLNRSSVNARLCERRFLVRHEIPDSIQRDIFIDIPLARELDHADRSVVYTFLVANVRRNK